MSLVAASRHVAGPVGVTVGAALLSYLAVDTLTGSSGTRLPPRGVSSSVSGWSAIEYRRIPLREYLKVLSGMEEVNGVADDRSVQAMLARLGDAPTCTSV